MSGSERLMLWIEQMAEATGNACSYVEGLDFAAFELDIKVVWDTVGSALPALSRQLPGLLRAAGEFGAE